MRKLAESLWQDRSIAAHCSAAGPTDVDVYLETAYGWECWPLTSRPQTASEILLLLLLLLPWSSSLRSLCRKQPLSIGLSGFHNWVNLLLPFLSFFSSIVYHPLSFLPPPSLFNPLIRRSRKSTQSFIHQKKQLHRGTFGWTVSFTERFYHHPRMMMMIMMIMIMIMIMIFRPIIILYPGSKDTGSVRLCLIELVNCIVICWTTERFCELISWLLCHCSVVLNKKLKTPLVRTTLEMVTLKLEKVSWKKSDCNDGPPLAETRWKRGVASRRSPKTPAMQSVAKLEKSERVVS